MPPHRGQRRGVAEIGDECLLSGRINAQPAEDEKNGLGREETVADRYVDGANLLPITLRKLFGGRPAGPEVGEREAMSENADASSRRKRRHSAISEKARRLELIATEESDEEPDDDALPGSGAEYEEDP